MKRKSLYIAAALGLAVFTACDDNWVTPPAVWPSAPEDMVVNEGIGDFKETFWTAAQEAQTIGNNPDGEHYIIEGRVVSSDRDGNVYKNLVIQSEDGTGLTFSVNNSKLYKTYQYGQRVVIDLTGLDMGYYRGLFQVGAISGTEMTFAAEDVFKAHAYPDGYPEPNKVKATVATIEELKNALRDEEQKRYWMSRVVTIENVKFDGAGLLTFADPPSVSSGSSRYIRDAEGRTLQLRNSSRASFQDEILPVGTGSVTGILSAYGTTSVEWQLLINDLSALKGDFRFIDAENSVPTMTPNTTIKEFKAEYWRTTTNSAELVGQKENGEDIIVEGVVISSDQSGNIYKNLVIRDDSGEAMTLAINATGLFIPFPQGQKIVLNLTGLYAGMYNNLFQVGGLGSYNGNPSMTFMDSGDFMAHVERNGKADPALATSIDVTIPEINAANTVEGKQQWQSQLVTFKGVKWQGGGELSYTEGSNTTNRYIMDAEGNTLLVRNSNYSDFASDKLPAGTGNVTGILSYYGSAWQLLLIDGHSSSDFTE